MENPKLAHSGRLRTASLPSTIRHPFQPTQLAAVVEVTSPVATSGNYERRGELLDPATGRAARGVASATVTGPELDPADALATGLGVRGVRLLEVIGSPCGFGAYLISAEGRRLWPSFESPGSRARSTPAAPSLAERPAPSSISCRGQRRSDLVCTDPQQSSCSPTGSLLRLTVGAYSVHTFGPHALSMRVVPTHSMTTDIPRVSVRQS